MIFHCRREIRIYVGQTTINGTAIQGRGGKTTWYLNLSSDSTVTGRHLGLWSVLIISWAFQRHFGDRERAGGGRTRRELITRVAENKHLYNRAVKANKVIKPEAHRSVFFGGVRLCSMKTEPGGAQIFNCTFPVFCRGEGLHFSEKGGGTAFLWARGDSGCQ